MEIFITSEAEYYTAYMKVQVHTVPRFIRADFFGAQHLALQGFNCVHGWVLGHKISVWSHDSAKNPLFFSSPIGPEASPPTGMQSSLSPCRTHSGRWYIPTIVGKNTWPTLQPWMVRNHTFLFRFAAFPGKSRMTLIPNWTEHFFACQLVVSQPGTDSDWATALTCAPSIVVRCTRM